MKRTLTLISGFFLFLVVVAPVHAALDISVSPVFLNYNPKPGETINDKITLHNNTTSPTDLTISVSKLGLDEQNNIVPTNIAATDPLLKWFKFSTPEITAPVNEWLEIPVTINIPKDAAFGNYFAIVFSAKTTDKTQSGASVLGNLLVPVLLNVQKPGAVSNANITSFSVKEFVNQFLPVEFTLTLKNSGNYHVSPKGNIFIRSQGAKSDTAILEVNPGNSFILPDASRTFNVKWTDGFAVRNPNGKLQFNWNKLTDFRFGKYTAHAFLVYENNGKDIPIESTLTFWVIPYTAIGIVLISLFVLIIGTRIIFKSMVKKAAQNLSSTG